MGEQLPWKCCGSETERVSESLHTPLGCGTKYVMDKNSLTGGRAAPPPTQTSLFQVKFVFLIGFGAQIDQLPEDESTVLTIDLLF